MEQILKSGLHPKVHAGERLFGQGSFTIVAASLLFACVSVQVHAQNLISNGGFEIGANGLTDWTQASWTGGSSFGINANGPTHTSAATGNYAYAGGGVYNVLQQSISGITTGNAYRLTFLAGSKSGQGSAIGFLSLHDGLAGNYNSASFDYNPSDAAFGSYTVDFTARGATDLWLRSDSTYAAYDNVSVTAIGSVANALNYSAASGFSVISSALTGSGKVTVNAGAGGLTLTGANTHTGGTEVTGGTLYVTGAGTLGATDGAVTVSGGGTLDLRNQQILTGTISMNNQNAKIISANSTGSIVNNGGAFQFGGGSLEAPLSGTGGLNVTGGGQITSDNSYTGATTISGTTGWFGQNQLFVANADALGAASGDLTISGGTVNLTGNTITRSGNVTVSGGSIENGTLSKSGVSLALQGGVVNASLAGTAGLIKSTINGASLNAANSYTGGTTISNGTLYVGSSGTLGDASGDVTVSGAGVLDLRNQQTRTGTITMTGQDAKIITGGGGSIVNNGGAFQFGGGSLEVNVSGTGGLNVTGGGRIISANSYTGDTTISATTGWFDTNTFFVGNDTALGAATGGLTISGGIVSLMDRTITRSGNVSITGGNVHTGTISKSGVDYDIRGGQIDAVLAGTVGLVKTGNDTATLNAPTYAGPTSVSAGTLVIFKNNLTATILANSLSVDFPSTPTAGTTYNILSGTLASASLGITTVTVAGGSLPSGLTATVINSPNLKVVVQSTPSQTPQEAYLASFGLSGANLLGTADPDGDGMDNNAEFAFGTSPISGASRATTLTSGTGEIILTYLQRKTGVTYTVKSLSNLTSPFDNGTPVPTLRSANQGNLPSADYERYEAKLRTDSSRGFLQVKAVVP